MPERVLTFESAGLTLSGTLRLPDGQGPFPAVLLVAGSGQVDRDENHKKLHINLFREIASYLAAREIATFRYDKRGVGASEGDFWAAGLYDNIADAGAALACLKAQDAIRPGSVFVMGHSEGSLISARLAAEKENVAGAILLSGTAQPGEDVLKWQARQVVQGLPGFTKALMKLFRVDPARSQQKVMDRIRASDKDWIRVQLFAKINAKWMREFMAHNPADDLARIEVPVLAIIGSKDIQVNPKGLERMKQLIPGECECHEVPGLSHLLRVDPKDPPSISTYKKQVRQPADQRVLDVVSRWLDAHVR